MSKRWESLTGAFTVNDMRNLQELTPARIASSLQGDSPLDALRFLAELMLNQDEYADQLLEAALRDPHLTSHWYQANRDQDYTAADASYLQQLEQLHHKRHAAKRTTRHAA